MSPHLRSRTATLIAYVVCAALLSACGDDDANTQTATDADPTDAATSSDADPTDAATSSDADPTDAATSSDADPTDAVTSTDADPTDTSSDTADVTTGPACAFPSPRQADEANALSADAAKCGQAPYTWLNDPSLGDVVGYGARLPLTAAAINDLATSEGITLPKPAVHDVRVIQYRYVTQAHGVPTEATSLAAFPTDLAEDAPPLPTLLILHGTSGFNDGCAPSSSFDAQGFAALFASFGYFVVAPDYIGLKGLGDPTGYLHPYLVGEPTAMASLDSVRAAGKLPEARIGTACASPEVIVLGGSQGGHAALWLDRLAPYYAPELQIAGVVATVPPADLLGQATRALQAPVSATGNTIAMLATQADWYGLRSRLNEVFVSPLDVDLPALLASTCDPGDAFDPTDLAQVFQAPILQAAADGTLADLSPWGCIFSENGLTSTSTPRLANQPEHYGILMIMGEADQLVHTPIERDSFTSLCADQDMPLQYLECAGAKHTATTAWAIPEILSFIDDRLAHKPFASSLTCQLSAPTRCLGTPADQP
jgi:dienelactone hydrolase